MNISLLTPGLLALSALSFLMVGCSAFDPRYGPESAKFRSAYWNSWFQDSRNGRLQDTLRVGREYEFMLDLSPYSYVQPGIRHKEVSPSLSEELKRQGDKLTVYVKPVLAGRGLEFLPGEAKTRRLTIDLKRIREPAGYKEGELLSVLSKRVSAGSVTISLKTTESGCAVVALSLWNQQLRPLCLRS